MPTTSTDDVSLIVHAIQLAIAPVFLLTGLGSMLSVMATRLSRVIDRARHLEERWQQFDVAANGIDDGTGLRPGRAPVPGRDRGESARKQGPSRYACHFPASPSPTCPSPTCPSPT